MLLQLLSDNRLTQIHHGQTVVPGTFDGAQNAFF